ncbi:F-box/kelch-repeat protein At2g44130-like [Punica granatum]|uniref:F-box domain-containing protein n=2 Tax=Punica granatum TaxID=22663 RepID=A0A218WM11_PUNGR|nr:F-box/kelch-repeat protein At2g44130-like [Punica granatum]OWM73400.1 hypothetical protein CDL15_Pgr026499 [Punica granatum]PKI71501.1 hypothetical protein CRG98_008018 [Punica granatum]
MEGFDSIDWVPGLPIELGLECLTRLPHSAHLVAAGVCRKWRELIQRPEFYHQRRHLGYTRKVACLVQALPAQALPDGSKPGGSPSYAVTVFDPASGSWERLNPVPGFPNGLPLFCQLAGCEGKLVAMGGWDPKSYDPVSDVFVYDFTTREWRVGAPMPLKRSFFAAAGVGGHVYVAGGHDESKNALRSAWAYDPRGDEWTELPQLSQERDECEGLAVNGAEFWVVSGYSTQRQGAFEGSAEVYEPGAAEWRRVDGAWELGQCPRSCVGMGKDGRLVSWAEPNSQVGVGACGVALGELTILTGSEYQGAPQAFYFGGQDGKFARISVPEEFTGFFQSGCCVEI